MTPPTQDPSHDKGERAEEVASWYFRLNGFLAIPGFVVHGEVPGRQITEADLLGVRFAHTVERLSGIKMTDERWMQELCDEGHTLVVIVEVKASNCSVNRRWSERSAGAMERAIRRLGFARPDEAETIANAMYDRLHWKGSRYVLQFVSIGSRCNGTNRERYPDLVQLTWDDIAAFLWERFSAFGKKKGVPGQWPEFGHLFAKAVLHKQIDGLGDSKEAIRQYIRDGEIEGRPEGSL